MISSFSSFWSRLNSLTKASLWGIFAACCFSMLMVFNKESQHIPLPLMIWGRCLFAACAAFPVLKLKSWTHHTGAQLFRGFCAAAAMLCTYSGYKILPLHEASILGTAGPLFIMFFAIFLLKEHVNWQRWCLFALGYLGVLLIVFKNVHSFSWDNIHEKLIMVGSNTFSGLVVIMGRWLNTKNEKPENTLWFGTIVPLLVFSLAVPFYWEPLAIKDWGVLGLLGVFGVGSAGGYLMAMRYAPASFLAPFEYLRPCILIPVSFFRWGTLPSVEDYIGMTFVLISSIWLMKLGKKKAFH